MGLSIKDVYILCRAKREIAEIEMKIGEQADDNSEYINALIRCENALTFVLANKEKIVN